MGAAAAAAHSAGTMGQVAAEELKTMFAVIMALLTLAGTLVAYVRMVLHPTIHPQGPAPKASRRVVALPRHYPLPTTSLSHLEYHDCIPTLLSIRSACPWDCPQMAASRCQLREAGLLAVMTRWLQGTPQRRKRA